MPAARVLALILAGGEGSRLEVLTEERAKPAMPYAGVYRLIDFPLSNCVHSRISDVWVLAQYQPHSLNDHLSNGRPWDLDRTHGGLRLMHPYLGKSESGWHRGNADAIYRNKSFIREFAPDVLLVLSADHVYKLDYGKVIERHLERKADVTMVTTQVPLEDASRFGAVEVREDGRVAAFTYKPESPQSNVVATEVFALDADKLMDRLEELWEKLPGDGEEASLRDLGHEVLPDMVDEKRAFEYRLEGYWRDVGTPESYWQGHMALLSEGQRITLDDPSWPILTLGAQRPPARIEQSARVENSLVSPGCTVRGTVIGSVLGPGVVVERGAEVRDSVMLGEATVGARAVIDTAIVDVGVRVGREGRIGARSEVVNAGEGEGQGSASKITLVGQRARISDRSSLPRGGRVKPGETY